MPAKRSILVNPFVNEYVYDQMMKVTVEQKRLLNGKYLKALRNSRTAKTFATKSTIEEKAILLAKLGIDFAWTFNISKEKLNEICEEGGIGKATEMANKMLLEKLMVVTGKQVLNLLGFMAANCHSEVYMMNRDFFKVGHRIKAWRKEYSSTTNKEMRDALIVSREMAKIFANSIMMSKDMEGAYGVGEVGLVTLLFIMSKQKEYVSEHEIKLYFNSVYRNFRVYNSVKILLDGKYIDRSYATKEKAYKITGMGIDLALKFQKKIMNLENF